MTWKPWPSVNNVSSIIYVNTAANLIEGLWDSLLIGITNVSCADYGNRFW